MQFDVSSLRGNVIAEYNQQDATFHNLFISVIRSTCFRRFLRPSSGAQNCTYSVISYVYWTVHHLDSWIKRDQLDVTCYIISLFNAQHVSVVSTSILRSLRLIYWVISCVVLFWFDVYWCYVVGNKTHEITQQISRRLLRMDVLTSETCWALNNEIKCKWHQVGLSLFNSVRYLSDQYCYLLPVASQASSR